MKIKQVLNEEPDPEPKQVVQEVTKRLKDLNRSYSPDTVYDVIWDILHEDPYKTLDDDQLMEIEHEVAKTVIGKLS